MPGTFAQPAFPSPWPASKRKTVGQHVKGRHPQRITIGASIKFLAVDNFRGQTGRSAFNINQFILWWSDDSKVVEFEIAEDINDDIGRIDFAIDDAVVALL